MGTARAQTVVVGAALLALALGAPAAAADEARAALGASVLLRLIAAPAAPRASALDESLKAPDPAPARAEGVVLPDGSVRYGEGRGALIVTVRNPCPPGTAHDAPPPWPGRRARN
ncbi:MAG TPA: hypothetical protein DDZ42_19075 [Candidatus Rokubacteria bacterium]|nr:hypothetical protein [Candidatus Rokubacteria bacterium]